MTRFFFVMVILAILAGDRAPFFFPLPFFFLPPVTQLERFENEKTSFPTTEEAIRAGEKKSADSFPPFSLFFSLHHRCPRFQRKGLRPPEDRWP